MTAAPSIQRGRSWGWWWRLWTTRLRRRPFCRRREASANCALLATPAAQPYYTTNVPDVRFFSTHFVSRQPVIIIAALPFTPKDFSYTRIYIYIRMYIFSFRSRFLMYIHNVYAFILSRVAYPEEGCESFTAHHYCNVYSYCSYSFAVQQ